MREKCRFLNEYGFCNALNVEKPKCPICNFYQTEEEWAYKEEKVRQWYKRRGIEYDVRLANLSEKEY